MGLVQNWGKGLLISGGGLVSGIVSGVTTFFIGLIFSLYILLQKEKLARQGPVSFATPFCRKPPRISF